MPQMPPPLGYAPVLRLFNKVRKKDIELPIASYEISAINEYIPTERNYRPWLGRSTGS